MKRKILEKIFNAKKKIALTLMLAGFAAINTGFTDNETPEELPVNEPAIEETSANIEPTIIAVNENGRLKISEDDELIRAFTEVVEGSRTQEISYMVDEPFKDVPAVKVPTFDENPAPSENVVETSEGMLPYSHVMRMEATAYLPTDGSSEGLTAMGIPARWGIVAVDPDVIPLGTRVYVPGYGVALAADVGGAINGYKIDLCMEDYGQAMDFGRRTVTVFVLK